MLVEEVRYGVRRFRALGILLVCWEKLGVWEEKGGGVGMFDCLDSPGRTEICGRMWNRRRVGADCRLRILMERRVGSSRPKILFYAKRFPEPRTND